MSFFFYYGIHMKVYPFYSTHFDIKNVICLQLPSLLINTVMQIEKALIKDRLRVSKVS